MDLLEMFRLASNSEFKNRVTAACSVLANNIITGPDTIPNYDNKLAMAIDVVSNAEKYGEQLVWVCVNDSTIQTSLHDATDAEIQAVVNSNIVKFVKAA